LGAPLNLAAQPIHAIKCRYLRSRILTAARILSRTRRLLCLPHLVIELLQSRSDLALRPIRVGIDPIPQPVRRPLHQVGQVLLIHPVQRIAQARRRPRLRGRKLARRVPHPFFQL
jgi:hypothetical protein